MTRGPYLGKTEDFNQAVELRKKGYSYAAISANVLVPIGTVVHWVRLIAVPKLKVTMQPAAKPTDMLMSKQHIRARLIKERGNVCEKCYTSHWFGKLITLEVHKHNEPKNRKLLCPNCHSQTVCWRRKKTLNPGVA